MAENKELTYQRVYHGTPYESGKKLINGGKSAVRLVKPSKKDLFNGPDPKRFRSIGSLGYGFYTFLEDPDLARVFAEKFADPGHVLVLELLIKLDTDTTLRFDSSFEDMKRFREFLNDPQYCKDIGYLREKYSNTKFQKSLDGALLELYCALLEEGKIANIQAICMPTVSGVGVKDATVPNGIEVLIKDLDVIVSDNFTVVQ
jgi:hypothetical protein